MKCSSLVQEPFEIVLQMINVSISMSTLNYRQQCQLFNHQLSQIINDICKEYKNERIKEYMNEWMFDEWMNEWMNDSQIFYK